MPRILVIITFAFFICLPGQCFTGDLRVITENADPGSFGEDGEPKGASVDMVREIMRRTGDTATIEFLPWARGFKLLDNRPNTALFVVERTEKRENQAIWVGPLFTATRNLWAKKGTVPPLKTPEDILKYGKVGTYRGDAGEALHRSMGVYNLTCTTNTEENYQDLLKGKIKLTTLMDVRLYVHHGERRFDPDELGKVMELKRSYLYVAFNPRTDPQIIEAWRKAF